MTRRPLINNTKNTKKAIIDINPVRYKKVKIIAASPMIGKANLMFSIKSVLLFLSDIIHISIKLILTYDYNQILIKQKFYKIFR